MSKPRATKRKSKSLPMVVEAHGVAVRIFKRGGTLYVALKGERIQSANGKSYTRKVTRSLGHADEERAIETAKAMAKQRATSDLTGTTPETLTLGQLAAAYLEHRGPLLSASRRRTVSSMLRLFRLHWTDGFRMVDLGQHEVDAYCAARMSGRLRSPDHRSRAHPGPATVRNEVQVLSTVCTWATGYRRGGVRC